MCSTFCRSPSRCPPCSSRFRRRITSTAGRAISSPGWSNALPEAMPPGTVAERLEGRLPRPVDDPAAWADEDEEEDW